MIGPARTDAAFLADRQTQHWAEIMTRASVVAPLNIDDLLSSENALAQHDPGIVIFPHDAFYQKPQVENALRRPSIAVLLPDQNERLPAEDVQVLATRYAALAIEKECDIVVLTYQHNAGFERFGFRVERIAGATRQEQEHCLEHLRAFWGFEVVI